MTLYRIYCIHALHKWICSAAANPLNMVQCPYLTMRHTLTHSLANGYCAKLCAAIYRVSSVLIFMGLSVRGRWLFEGALYVRGMAQITLGLWVSVCAYVSVFVSVIIGNIVCTIKGLAAG